MQQLARRVHKVTLLGWLCLAQSATPQRPLPWRALIRQALPLWLATRLLALVVTYCAQTLLQPHHAPVSLNSMVNSWRLWDGGFFGGVLLYAYHATNLSKVAFWPLYPLLSKPLEALLGPTRWQIALLITSNLATLAAFVLLGALAIQEDETLGASRRAMLLLAATPLALFLTAAYSDSLFLALACATLLCMRRGQWRAAALWALLAALTRPTGVILIAPLLWEYGHSVMDWRAWRRWLPMGAALLGAVPLAVEAFSFYCWRVYGDPLAWLHAEALFQHQAMAPWASIAYAWGQFWRLTPGSFQQARSLVDAIPLVFVLLLTLITLRRIPASYSLYLIGLLLTILVSPVIGAQFPETFVSAGRYLLAAIPCYLILARLIHRYPTLETPAIGGGFALQAILMAFVLTGGWLV